MNITLLGQGIEEVSENSVGNHLIKFLAHKDFHTFIGISAFASQSGVNGLGKYILDAKHLKKVIIIVGVDKKGTSIEALEALVKLKIESYVFHVDAPPIFHPKIYLFEGKEKSELIIGSSNLTSLGLFTNVETSLLVNIDNTIEADKKIVEQLKEYFKGLFDLSDPNLKKLTTKLISELITEDLIGTEAERKANYEKAEKSGNKKTGEIISKIFPKREIAKIPIEFRGTPTKKEKSVKEEKEKKTFIKSKPSKNILWQSGQLTERDLNIPKGSNTHPTGSMLFSKGETKEIDQRHYFRDTVFSSLNWIQDENPKTSHLERAFVKIKIIIDGIDSGDFELKLTHNSDIYSRSYEQKNSMTWISWGDAKKIIAKDDLIGKSASLYKNQGKNDEFTLLIK